jgi:adenylate cyclase, class 2
MSIEIEKKYRLTHDERERVVKRLLEIDARFCDEEFEENTLYSGGRIDSSNSVLRLRRVGNSAILTYKERLPSASAIKHQLEHETKFDDPDAMSAILLALGFRPSVVYEKRRVTWTVAETEVAIDELPFGLFMEIEGEEEAILRAEALLKISELQPESATYPQLAARLGVKVGEVTEARF